MKRRTLEPFLWTLFSAGGVVAALVLPILVLLFGIVFPLGWLAQPRYDQIMSLVHHPLTRIALFVVCFLSLFHAAHRFRFTLYDELQIKHLNELINPFCYGLAVAGTVVAGWLLWTFPK